MERAEPGNGRERVSGCESQFCSRISGRRREADVAAGSRPPARTQQFFQFTDAALYRMPPIWSGHTKMERIPARLEQSDSVLFSADCWKIYLENRSDYVIQQAGLTDPFIARMKLEFRRPGHPIGHKRLAADLASIRARFGKLGAFDKAVGLGKAPNWIVGNLEELKVVERKAYNQHDWLENFALAFHFIDDLPVPSGR
jgi:hypothetical protein